MAGQQHPGRSAQVGAGDDGVAIAVHPQSGEVRQRLFDQVGQGGLGSALGRDVDQGAGQLRRRDGEVQPCARRP